MKSRRMSSFVEARCGWIKWIGMAIIMYGLAAHAAQYVVPGGAGDQSGDSWANAWADVQTAVDAAELQCEEVWVAAGRYELTTPVTLRTNSVVLGGFTGTESVESQRDWDVNVTILDGLDKTQVVRMVEITDARFDGLIVTRGYYEAPEKGAGGGGILIEDSEACTIANCKVLYNTSVKAANNKSSSEGGGILINNSKNCVIENCLFTGNDSNPYGTSLSMLRSSEVIVTACRFVGCYDMYAAGVVRLQNNSNMRLVNCLASGNSTAYGSLVYVSQGLSVVNCTVCFTANTTLGGAFQIFSDNLIRNNILAFNGSVGIYEMTTTTKSDPYVECNLFHAQTVADYYDHDQSIYLSGADAINNDILPDRASGNVDGDPLFVSCPTQDDGTWTSVGTYDEERAQTTLVDTNAAFRPSAFKGRCLNPNTAETLYRHAEIADNTATSITVWGKVDWAAAGNGYRIYDFRLREDSPAVNAGLADDAPDTDINGNPRPALGGIDIGAYEAQPSMGTTLLIE